MIAFIIFWEAFSSPKGFGNFLSFPDISSHFSRILEASLIIFCVFVPTRRFAPRFTVSGHSVFSRSVMHGVFSQKASFCIPPESVRTSAAFFISFIVSW